MHHRRRSYRHDVLFYCSRRWTGQQHFATSNYANTAQITNKERKQPKHNASGRSVNGITPLVYSLLNSFQSKLIIRSPRKQLLVWRSTRALCDVIRLATTSNLRGFLAANRSPIAAIFKTRAAIVGIVLRSIVSEQCKRKQMKDVIAKTTLPAATI